MTKYIDRYYLNGELYGIKFDEGRLPSEYQEVEYIESTGTQYIDTGVLGGNTLSTELVMRPNMNDTTESPIFGDSWSINAIFLMEYDGVYRFHNGGVSTDTATVTDEKTTIITTPLDITINGTSYSLTAGSSYQNYNIYLFYVDDVQNQNPGKFKAYSFKISDNGTLIRDFVPCYRKSDNVIGMYDLVNDVFYTNSGSGDFTKGPNI